MLSKENFRAPLRLLNLKLGSPSHSSRSLEIRIEHCHWCIDGVNTQSGFHLNGVKLCSVFKKTSYKYWELPQKAKLLTLNERR